MSLSRDQILAKQDDLPTAEVPVPEWGDGASVKVRGLTAQERFDWGKTAAGDGAPEPGAHLIALSAIDDDGQRLFQAQDVDALAQLRGDVVERVAQAVMELSGLGDKAAEAAEGNSGATQSGASPTGSPATSDAPSES